MPSNPIYEHFTSSFEESLARRQTDERRIGAELKFPLVNPDGTAVDLQTIHALWHYLCDHGWAPEKDSLTEQVVGARKPGEQNDNVASCETGYCKTEFSLAHVSNLFELAKAIGELRILLRGFSKQHGVHFLGYGIQPVSRPVERLLMKRGRTSVWDVFASNRHIPEEEGDDMHLFTVNAASHVHVSVSREEAVPAVNVLNGFAGAQIALMAHSNIWRGGVDPWHKCVAEKFWDWWMPDAERVGMPEQPFGDLQHYVGTISRFRPVYVKRDGIPVVLPDHESFEEYYGDPNPIGRDLQGRPVPLVPESADIDLHNTCYWYNARISHYYTVENRVNDQQPPEEVICVAALTLGLMSALEESWEELSSYAWSDLRSAREAACRDALKGRFDGVTLATLAGRMVELAELGLRRRGLGEEEFLSPLKERLDAGRCPADDAEELFEAGGINALLAARSL